MNTLLYLSLCLSALFVSVTSLSCMRCDETVCTTPSCVKGVGLVKDICGCCDVCAKTEQQSCGGPWDMAGECDNGLSCVMRKNGLLIPNRGINLRPGKCEPTKCQVKNCRLHQTCTVINQEAVCECPRHCKNTDKPVCGLTNGVEYDNECQLRKYECKVGKKIGFKNGPCKRCSMVGRPYKFGEKIRTGRCELCSCAHGIWMCKNTCPVQAKPLIAPIGARCDIDGRRVLCGPRLVCKPSPNKSKGNVIGICSLEKMKLTVPIPESFPSPPPLPCPLLNCHRCKYGNMVDDNGCKTCQCKSKKSACSLPMDPGPCLAYHPRYYYNHKVGKCMKFIFGGCQPNANNFKSRKSCERKCLI